jgi:uncharacterized protein
MGLKWKVVVCWFAVLVLPVAHLAGVVADLRLVNAVKAKDKDAVRSLLNEKVDVNVPQPDGATPLQWAAYWDDLETAELLIRAGAKVNAADEYGVTPLTLACTNGNGAMVETLLKAGADPNKAVPTGETALMTCARTDSVDAVKSLLIRGANPNTKENQQGQTPLMWAVAEKRARVAQVLIEHGADPNAHSKGGFTPLMFAARVGDVESARVLLAAKVNVNEAMPASAGGMTPLLMASASGNEALSIFLLDNGADPNLWDGRASALHYAVMKGRFRPHMQALLKALLAHGADPNLRLVRSAARGIGGAPGATPFVLAAAVPDVNMMRILLEAGADPTLKTKANDTALMAAAGLLQDEAFTQQEQVEAVEAIKLMLELGADVNAVNDIGRAALHGATNMYANGIIQFLAEHGANVDVRDKYQVTPLSVAAGIYLPWIPKGQELAEQGFVKKDTVDLLLKLGATPLDTPGYFKAVEDSETYRLNPKQNVPGLP